jgi:hypothetical protein
MIIKLRTPLKAGTFLTLTGNKFRGLNLTKIGFPRQFVRLILAGILKLTTEILQNHFTLQLWHT